MNTKQCVAMIMAGGRGKRLGSLTDYYPKSAVHFGGNHRIIDFTLSNCLHSGIGTIGVLSQYLSSELHTYINSVSGCLSEGSGVYVLPPQNEKSAYRGTADAVYKNIKFINQFKPEIVLILSGDHIYNMNYSKMLDFHEKAGADVTVASTLVSINEASRFGTLKAEENGCVYGFEEKPCRPKSCLVSMGIYVFRWSVLKRYLMADSRNTLTEHDFGKDILPVMLHANESVYTYQFDGYWRDVGTVSSLWEANMDQINNPSECHLQNDRWNTQITYKNSIPDCISSKAVAGQNIVAEECTILGKVEHSVLGDSITVGRGSEVVDSVIMPGVYIGNNVKIYNAVIGTGAIIMNNAEIGVDEGTAFFVDHNICSKGISLVSPWSSVAEGMRLQCESHIYNEYLQSEVVYPVYNKYCDSLRAV